MNLYRFKCETCNYDEYIEASSEPPRKCPWCGETEYITVGREPRDEHELRLGVK